MSGYRNGYKVNGGRSFRAGPSAATLAKRRDAAEATVKAAGLDVAWTIFTAEPVEAERYEERTIRDIVARLARWGNISDKAMAYLKTLVEKLPERDKIDAERAATRAAEDAAADPVPEVTGRIKVEGEILCVKEKNGRFGPSLKMLVKAPAGYKLWGSVPRGLDAKRGDKVEFMASITRSDKDPKFGFFNRPKV
jgi:hypothetical protein